MKRLITIPFATLFVLVALLSACAGPPVDSGSTNSNTPQQANSNTAPGRPLVVQTLPPSELKPAADPAKPAANPLATGNANTANPANTSNAPAPKLVAPEKKIDYGKQPQDKTLVRAIPIRNVGRAVLNIESVVPS